MHAAATEAPPMRAVTDEEPERTAIRVVPFNPATDAATRGQETPHAPEPAADRQAQAETALELQNVSCHYGGFRAVRDVSLTVARGGVTALIGPSGCGKSTLLRTMNRMNDLVPSFRLEGAILLDGQDLYDRQVDPVAVRRRVGMVFQKPNPFPKSIFDNIAFGAKINGFKGDVRDLVEQSLRRAALWDEVKDKLGQSALALSGGQQQRLCIARAIATEPEIILMDEPCSALDPRATLQIEELMRELSDRYTIVIVTHNMQQAARASDITAFMTMGDDRAGYLVEVDETTKIFTNPREGLTEDYISGRFG